MSIYKVTRENLNEFILHIGKYQHITAIRWEAKELHPILSQLPSLIELCCSNNQITSLVGLKYCPNLQTLDCYINKITSLVGLEHCPNLQTLYCYNNQITSLVGLEHCPNLKILKCYNNQITSLVGLEHCPNLQKITCHNNQITSLVGLEHCPNLQKLWCSDNQITSLIELENCTKLEKIDHSYNHITSLVGLEHCYNLQELWCSDNKIISLSGLENCHNLQTFICNCNKITSLIELEHCHNLQELDCIGNKLTSLAGLENCSNLQVLDCYDNQITSLQPLLQLRSLNCLGIEYNPIELTIQTQNFIDRIQKINKNHNIYSDKQNVHDSNIQRSIFICVGNLLKDNVIESVNHNDLIFLLPSKLVQSLLCYCEDKEIHSYYLLTFGQIFPYVWNRIMKHKNKEELIKRFIEEMNEAECLCFTGRFNRLINTLNGFYDDIIIHIDDNSQISAIVINEGHKLIPYDNQLHYDHSKKLLLEIGYTEEKIQPWLDSILENYSNE